MKSFEGFDSRTIRMIAWGASIPFMLSFWPLVGWGVGLAAAQTFSAEWIQKYGGLIGLGAGLVAAIRQSVVLLKRLMREIEGRRDTQD